jgi:hypothetical protein
MIIDLISPWVAAAESSRPETAHVALHHRHAVLFDSLQRQRAPDAGAYPLTVPLPALHALAERASDPGLQQSLRDQLSAADDLGMISPFSVVLLAGGDDGDPMEALPSIRPAVVLLLDRCADDLELSVALCRGLAALTRWCAADSHSPIATLTRSPWDRWQLAREIPLGEWLYAEGLGVHLAGALLPDAPAHRLLGITPGALSKLRQREHALRDLLEVDLDQTGIGLILRWLSPQAPASARTTGPTVLPPYAGRYLAWRMLEERVGRVGIGEAVRMEAGD